MPDADASSDAREHRSYLRRDLRARVPDARRVAIRINY